MYLFAYITIIIFLVLQVPLAVDVFRFVYPQWKLSRLTSQTVHYLLIVVMGTIFCIALGYHLFVYLPLAVGGALTSLRALLHTAFAVWLWVNMVGNYYLTVFTHPGVDHTFRSSKHPPPLSPAAAAGSSPPGEVQVMPDGRIGEFSAVVHGTPEFCAAVAAEAPSIFVEGKPMSGLTWNPCRSHYCKVCGCAVRYLDHHCPFTGNCAGMENYSYFFLGLMYGTIGLGYAFVLTVPYFFDCNVRNILWYVGLVESRGTSVVCLELGPHTFIFLAVMGAFWIANNMFILHVFLILADLSTYNLLTNFNAFPVFRFALQRIKGGKFRDRNSALNRLILSRRTHPLWLLLPVRNSKFAE